MKPFYLILFISLLSNIRSQPVVFVSDKNDVRLKAYTDSLNCWVFGNEQLKRAKLVKDRNNIAEGNRYMQWMENYIKVFGINTNIQPDYYIEKYSLRFKIIKTGIIREWLWRPDIYIKPAVIVAYKPKQPEIVKPVSTAPKPAAKTTAPTKKVNIIYKTVSKDSITTDSTKSFIVNSTFKF